MNTKNYFIIFIVLFVANKSLIAQSTCFSSSGYVWQLNSTKDSLCKGETTNITARALNCTTSPSYCTIANSPTSCFIKKVEFAGINNATCTTDKYTYWGDANNCVGYVNAGSNFVLKAQTSTTGYVSIWIDYNGDGIFQNTEYNSVILNNTSAVRTISIPSTAVLGCTRMRIVRKATSIPSADACNTIHDQIQDYKIIIGNTFIGNYTYQWFPASALVVDTGKTVTTLPLTNTTTFTVVANTGICTDTSYYTAFVKDTIPNTTFGLSLSNCATVSANINVIATPSGSTYTYLWNTGSTSHPLSVTTAGTYTVRIVDSLGNCSINGIVIDSSSILKTQITNSYLYTCNQADNNTKVNITSGIAPFAFSWNTSPIQTTDSIYNIPHGTYTCTVTSAIGCTSTQVVNFQQNTNSFSLSASPDSICAGDSSVITLNVSTVNYPMSYGTSSANFATGPQIDKVVFPDVIGVPNINNTSGPGNYGSPVPVNGLPASALGKYSNYSFIPPPVLQLGNTYPISITVGSFGSGFSSNTKVFIDWTRDGDFLDPGEIAYTQPALVFGPSIINAFVTVPSSAVIGNTLMRIINSESSTFSSVGTYSFGETEDYIITIVSPTSFSWSTSTGFSGSFLTSSTTTSSTSFTVTPTATTTYTVTTTNSLFCTNTATVTVNVSNNIPGYSISTSSTPTSCGNNNGSISIASTPAGSFTYMWNTGDTISTISNVGAGAYSVQIKDSLGNCLLLHDTLLSSSGPSISIINSSPSIPLYTNDTLILTGNTIVGASYQWAGPIGFNTINNVATINGVTSANSGIYTYTLTDSNLCIVYTTITITVTPSVLLSSKVFLSGCFNGSNNMHDSLRSKNLIPLTEPYSNMPYNLAFVHSGGGGLETVSPTVLSTTGPNAIVDWVFIELRDASNFNTVVATKAALVQRDGDIVSSSDGLSPVVFKTNLPNNYFVAVRHRNHLGAATKNTFYLSEASNLVDFTTTLTPLHRNSFNNNTFVYSPTQDSCTRVFGTTRALYGANCNLSLTASSHKNIKYNGANNERINLFTLTGASGSILGYLKEDMNMNGDAKYNGIANDRLFIIQNVGLNLNNTVVEQTQ